MDRNIYKCKICGKPISHKEGSNDSLGRCRACYMKEKHEASIQKWNKEASEPPNCVICGKPIPNWSHKRARLGTKTCSRACTAKLTQLHITGRETKEQQIKRVVDGIKASGNYMTGANIRKTFHVELGKRSKMGLTATDLNSMAGFTLFVGQTADRSKLSREVVIEKYKQIVKDNRNIQLREVAKLLGVSADYISKELGIKASDIRRDIGISSGRSKTKEELESMILAWLKTQPAYCSAISVAAGLGIDYATTIRDKGIDIAALNMAAGHKYSNSSYCEEIVYHALLDEGFVVKRQKTYPDCRYKNVLRFDFWLPEYNVLVEADGAQHHQPKYPTYEATHMKDEIKNAYTAEHKIPLFRIDEAPLKTLKDRIDAVIVQIKGLPRVSEEVQTDSNCGDIQTDSAEDNPQPSHTVEGSTTIPDEEVHIE